MDILVVSQFFYPEQFRINDICLSLKEQGHNVTVLTGLPNYPTGKIPNEYRFFKNRRQTINGINIVRVPLISRKKGAVGVFFNYLSFAVTSSLYALFCNLKFDTIYIYQVSPVTMALPALILKKRKKKKVLLYCLDIWPECLAAKGFNHSSIIYKILFHVSKYIYKHVDKIAVASESFKLYFKTMFNIDAEEMDYVPQYAESIYSTEKSISFGYKSDEINLVYAGNIGEMQSVETIIRAADLTRGITNLKWHIVGEGSAAKRCKELAKKLQLDDIVIFHGYKKLNEMLEYYDMADGMIVTLDDNKLISYTIPGKIQSYMAAGKPIIGAINGEGQKILRNANCGLCCDANDYKSLANEVRQFISEKEKIPVYAKNSLNYYQNNFEKDVFLKNTINILESL